MKSEPRIHGKVQTADSLTVVVGPPDQVYTLNRSDSRFTAACEAAEAGSVEALVRLMSRLPEPDVSDLPATLANHVVGARGKKGVLAMDAFMRRVRKNPDQDAVASLADHVAKHGLRVTPRGFLVTYKRVRENLTSWYDPGFQYVLGKPAVVDRSKCAPAGLSIGFGLHSTAWQHVKNWYSGGKVLQLLVDPADFVAAPPGSTLWRSCKMLPILVMNDLSCRPEGPIEEELGEDQADRVGGVINPASGYAHLNRHGLTWLVRRLKPGLLTAAGIPAVHGKYVEVRRGRRRVTVTAFKTPRAGFCSVPVDMDGHVTIPLDVFKQSNLTPKKSNAGYTAEVKGGDAIVITPNNPNALL